MLDTLRESHLVYLQRQAAWRIHNAGDSHHCYEPV